MPGENLGAGGSVSISFFQKLFQIAGSSSRSVEEIVERFFTEEICAKFNDDRMQQIVSSSNVVPQWVSSLIAQSFGRKIIFSLYQKFPQSYFIHFCFNKIIEMGFSSMNLDFDIELETVQSPQKFYQYVESFLTKLLSSRRRVSSLLNDAEERLTEREKIPPVILRFLQSASFSPHNFAMAQHLILQRLNPSCREINRVVRRLSEILLAFNCNSNGIRKEFCYRLIFPEFFSQISKSETEAVSVILKGEPNWEQSDSVDTLVALFQNEHFEKHFCSAMFQNSPFLRKIALSAFFSSGDIRNSFVRNRLWLIAFLCAEGNSECESKENRIQGDFELLIELKEIYNSKGFSLSVKKFSDRLCRLVKNPTAALTMTELICSMLKDRDYYNSTHHSVTTPFFAYLLSLVVEEHSFARGVIQSTAEIVILFELPKSFGALFNIELRRHCLILMLCSVQNQQFERVMKFIRENANRLDLYLTRLFVTKLLGMVGAPFSKQFLASLMEFLVSEEIKVVLEGHENCREAVEGFIRGVLDRKTRDRLDRRLLNRVEGLRLDRNK